MGSLLWNVPEQRRGDWTRKIKLLVWHQSKVQVVLQRGYKDRLQMVRNGSLLQRTLPIWLDVRKAFQEWRRREVLDRMETPVQESDTSRTVQQTGKGLQPQLPAWWQQAFLVRPSAILQGKLPQWMDSSSFVEPRRWRTLLDRIEEAVQTQLLIIKVLLQVCTR